MPGSPGTTGCVYRTGGPGQRVPGLSLTASWIRDQAESCSQCPAASRAGSAQPLCWAQPPPPPETAPIPSQFSPPTILGQHEAATLCRCHHAMCPPQPVTSSSVPGWVPSLPEGLFAFGATPGSCLARQLSKGIVDKCGTGCAASERVLFPRRGSQATTLACANPVWHQRTTALVHGSSQHSPGSKFTGCAIKVPGGDCGRQAALQRWPQKCSGDTSLPSDPRIKPLSRLLPVSPFRGTATRGGEVTSVQPAWASELPPSSVLPPPCQQGLRWPHQVAVSQRRPDPRRGLCLNLHLSAYSSFSEMYSHTTQSTLSKGQFSAL